MNIKSIISNLKAAQGQGVKPLGFHPKGFTPKVSPQRFHPKGFTLVELLIVVALLGLSVGVTTDILLSVTKNYNKTQVLNEVEQQANFTSLKITKELRTATNVISPTLTDTEGTTLKFLTRSGNEIEYYLDTNSGILFRKETVSGVTGDPYPVISANGTEGVEMVCDTKCFTLTSKSPDILNFSMTFQKSNTGPLSSLNSSIKIEDTIVLRGTY